MNDLLVFFALPLATVIISIALQKIFKCPFLVAGVIFAIFLIVTFAIGNLIYLIAAIIYTIISFITAVLMSLICKLVNRLNELDGQQNARNNIEKCCNTDLNCCNNQTNTHDLLTISSSCGNTNNGDLLTISSNCADVNNNLLTINSNSNQCGCRNCGRRNGVSARINVIPNNNGNTGTLNGCYKVCNTNDRN